MKQQAVNTFNEGMIMDLTPLVTPSNVLTDALNATIITFNGNEFQLQNDQGNCKVERARLSPGFIPLGMKEYAGIIYVASLNPETGEEEIGSFPSPERDFSTTDFENIQPVKFRTEDFVVTTSSPVDERLQVIGKLMEPELFQLKPGDKYVVVYDINAVIDPGSGADLIEDQGKMDEYISKDVLNRKLFRLKFYRISDDNNLSDMDPDTIKVIPDAPDIEDEYVFFKESSKGTIAVGLELEGLDMFEANVINRSRKTDVLKKVAIEAIGYSNSMADFEGVRVEVTTPEINTFFIDKTGAGKKVSAVVSDLASDAIFRCALTPYSKYALYPRLRKEFQVDLGNYISAGSGVNNVYRWKTFDNYIKVDFDFNFEGDSVEGLQLYVEFYDPWSDYSVIKLVDNPTYYGTNSITLDLINEPAVDIFTATNIGGTPANQLIAATDNDYLKSILNESGLIRKTTTLRKNHFYIVRISGVDKVDGDYNHYDLYKGLYTTTMFNTEYDASLQLSAGDPLLDFNTYKFKLEALKFKAEELNSVDVAVPATSEVTDGVVFTDDPVTNTRYYYLIKPVTDTNPVSPNLTVARVHKRETSKDVRITLEGKDQVFGEFKDELVTIEEPTPGEFTPVVTDTGWDGNAATSPDSAADIAITNVSADIYKIRTRLSTKRKLNTTVTETTASGFQYAPNTDGGYPLARGLATYEGAFPMPVPNGNDGSAYATRAVLGLTLRMGNANNQNRKEMWARMSWRAQIGLSYRSGWSGGVHKEGPLNDYDLYSTGKLHNDIAEDFQPPGSPIRPLYSAYWTTFHFPNIWSRSDNSGSKEYVQYWFPGAPWPFGHDSNSNPQPTIDWGSRGMVTMIATNGQAYYVPMTDIDRTKKFFDDLRVGYRLRQNFKVYAHGNATIFETGNVTTTAKFPDVEITSKFTPEVGEPKTYLSTFIQKAKDVTSDFSADIINDYIAERIALTDSTIVDGKNTVGDKLIPYIEQEILVENPIDIKDLVITQSSDAATLARINSGRVDALASPQLTEPPNYVRGHGELFSVDPTISQSLLSKFIPRPAFENENTAVDPTQLTVMLNASTDLGPQIRGEIKHGAWDNHSKRRAWFGYLLNDPVYRQ